MLLSLRQAEIVKYFLGLKSVASNPQQHGYPLGIAVKNGDLEIANLLLALDNIDVNWYSDNNPIFEAAKLGNLGLVKALLAHQDIDPNGFQNFNPLAIAIQNGHFEIAEALLAHQDINPNGYRELSNPLYEAAKKGNLSIVESLLRFESINPNGYPGRGNPLEVAAENGHLDVVKALLKHPGIDPNGYGPRTPLWFAAKNGHSGVVKVLLEVKGIDCNRSGESYPDSTPLYAAVKNGYFGIVKDLIDRGATLSRYKDRSTPLLDAAASGGHLRIMELLLNTFNFTPKEKAHAFTQVSIRIKDSIQGIDIINEIMNLLLKNEPLLNRADIINDFEGFCDPAPLYDAAFMGPFFLPLRSFSWMREQEQHIETTTSPLWHAVDAGDFQKVKFLIQKGAIKNFSVTETQYVNDDDAINVKTTPYQRARQGNHMAIAAYLKWVDTPNMEGPALIHQVFSNYSKAHWGSETGAMFGRFMSGQWGNNYGALVSSLLLKEDYKTFTPESLKAFCKELKEKIPQKINRRGDLFAILALMKEETGIDFNGDLSVEEAKVLENNNNSVLPV